MTLVASPAAHDQRVAWDEDSAYREFRDRVLNKLKGTQVQGVVFNAHRRPPRLRDLHSAIRFGPESLDAEAHWVGLLRADLPRGTRLWWWPSSSSNTGWTLKDRGIRLRTLLASLPVDIGIVWTGPARLSADIQADDLRTARSFTGSRPLTLRDGYPMNYDPERLASALVLGPLRGRDAELLPRLDAYVAEPMHQLAASHLALLTTRAWLAAPQSYDPTTALSAAIISLAGENRESQQALKTQAAEWGGGIGERNYKPAWIDTPRQIANRLGDPAFVGQWKWTRERYPERIAALDHLADKNFGKELTAAMRRRLTLGRVIPLVLDHRKHVDRTDASALQRIHEELLRVREDPDTEKLLRRFLHFAGILEEISSMEGVGQDGSVAGSRARKTEPPPGTPSTQIAPP